MYTCMYDCIYMCIFVSKKYIHSVVIKVSCMVYIANFTDICMHVSS